MINHTRTLLANLDGQGMATGPGEEYSPPDYKAVPLPTYLRTLRTALYGRAPDRRAVLYRTRQFMALLHVPDLAGFVTADDARITYLPVDRGGIELAPGVGAAAIGGHTHQLIIGGDPPVEAPGGKLAYAWTVTLTA